MYETRLTIIGNIVNNPVRHRAGEHDLIKFRVASNSRRRAADGTWETGNSLFITVTCWDKLVQGVGASLGKGMPVIVVGNLYTSEYEDKDGVRRSSVEMRATAVGPDLARCAARVERFVAAGPENPPAPARIDEADDADRAEDESAVEDGMALTA